MTLMLSRLTELLWNFAPNTSDIMNIYEVTVYTGHIKERIEIKALNTAHLKKRVAGLGYDRYGSIHKVTPE